MKGEAHEDLDTDRVDDRFANSGIRSRLPGRKERRIHIWERVGSRTGQHRRTGGRGVHARLIE